MTITDIVELDKKRCKVYIDGEFAFVLYKGELREYGIGLNLEISETTYEEITGTLLSKRAKLRAMNLLQKRDYTERQLRDKLCEGLYPSYIIDEAISYVKSYRYLDDERFARDYITYHLEMRSRNRIIQDLTGKGISKEVILPIMEELYQQASDNADSDIEQEQIGMLLEKKHYSNELEYKEKQKIMGFLLRRGYSMDSIRKAMNHYN